MNSIRFYRENKDWSQTKLAEVTGIAQPTISAYESGDKEMMVETAAKIAKALNVSIDDLLAEHSYKD